MGSEGNRGRELPLLLALLPGPHMALLPGLLPALRPGVELVLPMWTGTNTIQAPFNHLPRRSCKSRTPAAPTKMLLSVNPVASRTIIATQTIKKMMEIILKSLVI